MCSIRSRLKNGPRGFENKSSTKKANGNETVRAGRYLLAVNTTAHDLKFQIKIPTTQTNVVAFEEDRILALSGGFAHDEIQPYAIHVYGPF